MLVGERYFGSGIESEVVIVVFLVEVFLEFVTVEFLLLVPVAEFGLGGKTVSDVVVMHGSYILLLIRRVAIRILLSSGMRR